jgi:hypothetical protein
MTRITLLLTLAAAALGAWGCGGSSTSGEPAASPGKLLTPAELVAKGDAICRPTVERVNRATLTPERIVRFAAQYEEIEDRTFEELKKLNPPSKGLGVWVAVMDGFRLAGEEFGKLRFYPPSVSDKKAFEPVYEALRRRAATAAQLGFKDCARE